MDCTHPQIDAHVTTTTHAGAHQLSVRATCRVCGQPFQFRGVPVGQSSTAPSCTASGLTVRLPIVATLGREHRCPECSMLLWGLPPLELVDVVCGPSHSVSLRDYDDAGPLVRRFVCGPTGTREITE